MPTPGAVQTIKRTELPGGTVVLTTRKSDAFCIRPYATFSLLPTSKFAQRLTDHTCSASALHAHDVLARDLMKARERVTP